jgi:hypothetical protein
MRQFVLRSWRYASCCASEHPAGSAAKCKPTNEPGKGKKIVREQGFDDQPRAVPDDPPAVIIITEFSSP